MKFTQRLAYYLSGFAIGLIILMFFLNGKEASCDYGPNARTVKNISSKPIALSDESTGFVRDNDIDSLTVVNLIKYGSVDFSKSNTQLDSCKIYHIDNTYKDRAIELTVENCDSLSSILKINYLK